MHVRLKNIVLDRITDIIIREYRPEKILLFGSMVSGDVHDFSDIDLVVVKDSEKPFFKRLEEVILLTMPKVGTEILVYTPDEFASIQNRLFVQCFFITQ